MSTQCAMILVSTVIIVVDGAMNYSFLMPNLVALYAKPNEI